MQLGSMILNLLYHSSLLTLLRSSGYRSAEHYVYIVKTYN
jgi:hypothetical protein